MATGIRACFDSCLSDGKSFFTDKKNHLARYMQSSEGRDKGLKFLGHFTEAVADVAIIAEAPEPTLEGIGKAHAWIKAGRDIYAIFNIFAGIIGALVEHIKHFLLLLKSMFTGEEAVFHRAKKEADKKYCDSIPADTKENSHKLEKFLAAGENFGKGLSCAAYIVGFGFAAPIKNIDKHIRDKNGKPIIPMSDTTREFGHSFVKIIMPINHVGGLIGSSCGLGYHSIAFNRFCETGGADADAMNKAYTDYVRSIVDNVLGFVEKLLEILYDIVVITGIAAPAWYRIPVTLGIGTFGVYKEWRKTEAAAAA